MNRLRGISLLYLLTLCYINLSSGVYIDINNLYGKGLKILKYTKNNVKKTIIYSTTNLPITGLMDNGSLVWSDYLSENCEKIIVNRFAHSRDLIVEVFLLKPMFTKTKIYLKHKGEYSRITKQIFRNKIKILSEIQNYGPEKIFTPQVETATTSEQTRKRRKPTLQPQTKPKAKKRKKTPTTTKDGQTSEDSEAIISSTSSDSESESSDLSQKIDESSDDSDESTTCEIDDTSSESSVKAFDPSHKVVLENVSEGNLSDKSGGLLSDVPSDLSFERSVTPVETPIPTPSDPVFDVSEGELEAEIVQIEISSDSDVDLSKNTKIQSDVKKTKVGSFKKGGKGTKIGKTQTDPIKTRVRSVQTESKRTKIGKTQTDPKKTEDSQTQTDAKIDIQEGKSVDEKKTEVSELRITDSIKAEDGSHGDVTPLEKKVFPTDLYHQDSSLEFEIRKKLRSLKESKFAEESGDKKLPSKYILDITNLKSNPLISYHYEINDGIVSLIIKVKEGKVINHIVAGNQLIHKSIVGKLLCLTIFSLFGQMKLMEIIMEEEIGNYVMNYKKGVIFWVESDANSFQQSYLDLKKEITHIADVSLDISSEIDESLLYCRSIEKNGLYQLIYYPKTGYYLKRIKCITSLVWRSDTRRCLSATLTMDKNDIIRLIKLELLDPTDNNVRELHFFLSNDIFTRISESLYEEILDSELINTTQTHDDSDDSDDSYHPSPIKQFITTQQFIPETTIQQPTPQGAQEPESDVLIPETVHVELESDDEEIDVVNLSDEDITKVSEPADESSTTHKEEIVKITPIKPIPIRPIPHLPPTIPPPQVAIPPLPTVSPTSDTPPEPIASPTSDTPPEPIASPTSDTPPEPIASPTSDTPPEPIASPTSDTPPEPIASPTLATVILGTKKKDKDKEKGKKDKKPRKPRKPKARGAKQTSGDISIPSGIKDITSKNVDVVEITDSSSVEDDGAVSGETVSVGSEDDNDGLTVQKVSFANALVDLNIFESQSFIEESYDGIKCKTFYPPEGYGFKRILYENFQIWCGWNSEFSNFVRVCQLKGGPMVGLFRTIKRIPFNIRRHYFVELYNGKWTIIEESDFKLLIEQYVNSDSEDNNEVTDNE
ncbi:putative integral membrane protein [Theileria parva strain Muguga]|uniref:TashAT2 protein, putative n=1 Tax=Theileria parva TaxID=5875 RepID=Q4N850_THEPA|nr:uncharacterized protein TpMuguga_01g00620 [Theileria parva strain Muguga]EAN33858.1 putative integral membrane protein [Theileria parva strain Muguga]|eukprot:XP_766141.1 hypothetical protein [Theileria parva strain Muguga]